MTLHARDSKATWVCVASTRWMSQRETGERPLVDGVPRSQTLHQNVPIHRDVTRIGRITRQRFLDALLDGFNGEGRSQRRPATDAEGFQDDVGIDEDTNSGDRSGDLRHSGRALQSS